LKLYKNLLSLVIIGVVTIVTSCTNEEKIDSKIKSQTINNTNISAGDVRINAKSTLAP